MSTITAILEAHPDGSLHLPLPENLRHTKLKVTATLEPVSTPAPGEVDANGWPKGFFDRVAGSMPELSRAPQGQFEKRLALE